MATTMGTSSAAGARDYDMSQAGHGDHAGGGDFLDLVPADFCVFAWDGLDGAGV